MMEKGIFEGQDIWYHDLDAFQLEPFDFPYFEGDWGTSVYPNESILYLIYLHLFSAHL